MARAGDRFFFPKYPDLTVYHQPRQFDTQSYAVEKSGGTTTMRIEFEIKHAKADKPDWIEADQSGRIDRESFAARGVRKMDERRCLCRYGLRTSIEFTSTPTPKVPVGMWHLIQMPYGGDMFVPTYGPSEPKIVFGEIPKGDLTELPRGGMRYRMTAKGEQKISLRAARCTGRAAYLFESGSATNLVLRNFFVNPSGEYVDAP